jgi:hypothetical protein
VALMNRKLPLLNHLSVEIIECDKKQWQTLLTCPTITSIDRCFNQIPVKILSSASMLSLRSVNLSSSTPGILAALATAAYLKAIIKKKFTNDDYVAMQSFKHLTHLQLNARNLLTVITDWSLLSHQTLANYALRLDTMIKCHH